MIYLARHGETAYNAEGRFQGRGDVGLTDAGLAQAHELAKAAEGHGIVRVVSSPLRRAQQTAEIVGAALSLEVETDDRFAETDTGDWTDLSFDYVQRAHPEAWAAYHATDPGFAFPGGESLEDQMERVVDGLVAVTQAHRLPALIICHRGVIRVIRSHTHQRGLEAFMSWDIPNGSMEVL